MNETKCSWEEFKREVTKLRAASLHSSSVLFRGHGFANWQLQTTLERSSFPDGVMGYYRLILRLKAEIETSTGRNWSDIPAFLELETITQEYDSFSRALANFPHYQYMAYLRHHGFPSPLLDWSASPFVAAYFAFKDTSDARSSEVAIYSYTERKLPYKILSSEWPMIHRLGPYVPAHRRHFAQQSQYTICAQWLEQKWRYRPHSEVFDKQAARSPSDQDVLHKFVLDGTQRPQVLRELADYNLNAYTLFQTEEGLMETLSVREELGYLE